MIFPVICNKNCRNILVDFRVRAKSVNPYFCTAMGVTLPLLYRLCVP